MDDEFAIVIVSLLLLVFGIILGVRTGEEMAKGLVTKRDYALANLKVFVIGAVISAVVYATGLVVLVAFTLGLIAGAIAGLKFGFGESVGPWKFHDKAFHVNEKQVEVAESGKGEARRRRRKEGGPEPELMSVAQPTSSDNEKKGSH